MTTTTEVRPSTATDVSAERLKSFVERLERLDSERKGISDDIKDVYDELSGTGFDKKAVREIIKLRKKEANERREEQDILETYMRALGMA